MRVLRSQAPNSGVKAALLVVLIYVYTILPVVYEWNEAKRAANLKKHGLDFADVDLVLESEYVRVVNDRRPGEPRKLAFAYVFEVLVVLRVVFVDASSGAA